MGYRQGKRDEGEEMGVQHRWVARAWSRRRGVSTVSGMGCRVLLDAPRGRARRGSRLGRQGRRVKVVGLQ